MDEFSCIEVRDCKKAEKFLEYLTRTDDKWFDGLDCNWVFRGHTNSDWKLIPSAWRNNKSIELVEKQLRKRYQSMMDTSQHANGEVKKAINKEFAANYLFQEASEGYLLCQFSRLSDELGFFVPNDGKKYCFIERFLTKTPAQLLVPSPAISALAQHHGIPTRLLDWTRKPEIAAFFASSFEDQQKNAKKIAVWAMHRDVLDHHVLTELTCPRSDNHFLHAQDGLFSYDSRAHSVFINKGYWPCFEETIENCINRNCPEVLKKVNLPSKPLRKITLPTKEINNLRELLWKKRISKAHLMPTYDNITKSIFSILEPTKDSGQLI